MTNTRKDKIGTISSTALDADWYSLHADPLFWRGKAIELKNSALVLARAFAGDCERIRRYAADHRTSGSSDVKLNHHTTLNQFVLLAAFSLENLFKAFVILKEPQLVSAGQIDGIIKSHDLVALADRAGVVLSHEERRFCVLGFSSVVSWGRYPISRSGKNVVDAHSVSGAAVGVFEALFERAEAQYSDRFHGRTRTHVQET